MSRFPSRPGQNGRCPLPPLGPPADALTERVDVRAHDPRCVPAECHHPCAGLIQTGGGCCWPSGGRTVRRAHPPSPQRSRPAPPRPARGCCSSMQTALGALSRRCSASLTRRLASRPRAGWQAPRVSHWMSSSASPCRDLSGGAISSCSRVLQTRRDGRSSRGTGCSRCSRNAARSPTSWSWTWGSASKAMTRSRATRSLRAARPRR
ncbi:hypothetical protein ACFPRL_10950 [Pseudoclavibacter helvolus]